MFILRLYNFKTLKYLNFDSAKTVAAGVNGLCLDGRRGSGRVEASAVWEAGASKDRGAGGNKTAKRKWKKGVGAREMEASAVWEAGASKDESC